MTVSSTLNRNGPLAGNDVTTSFAWGTYTVLDESTLKVYQTIGTVTTEVTTGITKNGVPGTSGSVVFDTAPATGVSITIIRESDFLQSSDYAAQGRVTPEQVEDDLDRAIMAVQDLKEEQSRSLKVDISSSVEPELPPPSPGSVIGWNGTGTALTNTTVVSGDDTPVSATNDEAVLRWNSATGGIQDGPVFISDLGDVTGVNDLAVTGNLTVGNATGVDVSIVTGTAGASGTIAKWNADGDLVDGTVAVETAALSYGAVGTYCFATTFSQTTEVSEGGTIAGSELRPTSGVWGIVDDGVGILISLNQGTARTGTWRAMCEYDGNDFDANTTITGAGLWLRIA